MPNKQGYQYSMAHTRLFVFVKGIIDYFSAMLVLLKLEKSQYCQWIMHASKDAFRGIYS
jgi:hypothetical protein